MKKLLGMIVLLMSIGLWAAAPEITASLSLAQIQKFKSSASTQDAHFGQSVAMDGNVAIIGEWGYDSKKGRAYVYEYNPTSHLFEQKAILKASDGKADDHFGESVAISGDTVIIGAEGKYLSQTDPGKAYIYVKPSGGWAGILQEDVKLQASDGRAGDEFGKRVAISGDTVVIGAANNDNNGHENAGAAYIYEKSDLGWSYTSHEKAKLTASDANDNFYFASSVAISGDTVVIGALLDDEVADDAGAAYIYEKPQSGWEDSNQTAKLTASDANVNENLGRSVAISGDTVVVGASGDNEAVDNSGAAYIYEKPQNGWKDSNQTAKLKASDAQTYHYFGWSIAIDADTVVIGAQNDDNRNNSSGAIYVYKKPQSGWAGTLHEKTKLKSFDADRFDYFGSGIAISGDTVVVGASGDNETVDNSGAAYFFTHALVQNTVENKKDILKIEAVDANDDDFTFSLDGGADEAFFKIDANSGLLSFKTVKDFENPQDADRDNIYEANIRLTDEFGETNFYHAFIKVSDVAYEGKSLKASQLKMMSKLKSSSPKESAWFGNSVSVDGDTAVIGEVGRNSGTGRAYVYEYNATSHLFEQVAILRASDGEAGDKFGISVSISGDTIVVGAFLDDDTNTDSGAAYIYEKPLNGWENTAQENAKLKAHDADQDDEFGTSVSISGDTIVVGAPEDDETNSRSGAAYIYEKPLNGWVNTAQENAKLKAHDTHTYDAFGYSVAISGNTVVVGADRDDDINTNSGAAYIYEKPLNGWTNTAQENAKLKAHDAGENDHFGKSIAISGDTVIVGASWDDNTNNNDGSAYIYEKPQSGWTGILQENAKLQASDANRGAYFGTSVAISSDTVVVGAINDDNSPYTVSGAAYIYEKPQGGWTNSSQENAKLKASNTNADDYFSNSVAVSGDTVIVGAYGDNGTNSDEGAAYVYKAKKTGFMSAVIMYLLN